MIVEIRLGLKTLNQLVREFKKKVIEQTINEMDGSNKLAAKVLGLSQNRLDYYKTKLDIEKRKYANSTRKRASNTKCTVQVPSSGEKTGEPT